MVNIGLSRSLQAIKPPAAGVLGSPPCRRVMTAFVTASDTEGQQTVTRCYGSSTRGLLENSHILIHGKEKEPTHLFGHSVSGCTCQVNTPCVLSPECQNNRSLREPIGNIFATISFIRHTDRPMSGEQLERENFSNVAVLLHKEPSISPLRAYWIIDTAGKRAYRHHAVPRSSCQPHFAVNIGVDHKRQTSGFLWQLEATPS